MLCYAATCHFLGNRAVKEPTHCGHLSSPISAIWKQEVWSVLVFKSPLPDNGDREAFPENSSSWHKELSKRHWRNDPLDVSIFHRGSPAACLHQTILSQTIRNRRDEPCPENQCCLLRQALGTDSPAFQHSFQLWKPQRKLTKPPKSSQNWLESKSSLLCNRTPLVMQRW